MPVTLLKPEAVVQSRQGALGLQRLLERLSKTEGAINPNDMAVIKLYVEDMKSKPFRLRKNDRCKKS